MMTMRMPERQSAIKPIHIPPIILQEMIARKLYSNNTLTAYKNITFYHCHNNTSIGYSRKLSKYIVHNTAKVK